ncbi:Tgl5/Tgl4 [Kluyveromyces lactis]|nr:Tgl5/Tgl4 [Kluyveromyces lactis]
MPNVMNTPSVTDIKDDPITSYVIKNYYKRANKGPEMTEEQSRNDSGQDEPQLNFFSSLCNSLYKFIRGADSTHEQIGRLIEQKQNARSLQEWLAAATKLDDITNAEQWKSKRESVLYDYCLVESSTEAMKKARLAKDWPNLLYLIRTTWVRNRGGMGNVNLYRHSYVGTKHIIEDYVEESSRSLQELVYNSDLDDTYLLGMLTQTRKNIGRTALVLSGGGTFGLFHIGILVTLFEQELLPRVISGSSAGAIVASILASRQEHELMGLMDEILVKDFNIFKDDLEMSESENLLIKISRFFKNGTWFDNKNLVSTMINFLGNLTFREAYNRSGKILNITVSPASVHEQPRLLNNLTSPNVLIWSAVCASCSLPGIFPSSPLYEKDPKTGETKQWNSSSVKFVDGSVDNDLPVSKLSEMFNVDHIIACQVNIHVFPFLKLSVSCVGGEIEDEFSARFKMALGKVYKYMASEVIHALEIATEIGIGTNVLTKLRSVLSQQYSGDITILPEMNTLLRFNELLSNPTQEFLLREATNGIRASWPKISIIKNHCGQEFELDKMINYLKGKIISNTDIKGNPFQISNRDVPLINSPVLANSEKKAIQVFDDVLLNADNLDNFMVVPDGTGSLKSQDVNNSPRYSNEFGRRAHNRRKSDSATNGNRKGKRHNSISLPYSSSSSPLSEKKYSMINFRPSFDKKISTGDLQVRKPYPYPPKSSSFSRIDYDPRSNSLTPILDHAAGTRKDDSILHSDVRSNPNSPLRLRTKGSVSKRASRKNPDTA